MSLQEGTGTGRARGIMSVMSPGDSTHWGPSLGCGAGGQLPVTGTSTGTAAGHSVGPQTLLPVPLPTAHIQAQPDVAACPVPPQPAVAAGPRALFLCHFCAFRGHRPVLPPGVRTLASQLDLFTRQGHKEFASPQGVNHLLCLPVTALPVSLSLGGLSLWAAAPCQWSSLLPERSVTCRREEVSPVYLKC